MAGKTKTVKCGNCKKEAEVFAASIATDEDTTWQCPHCGKPNTIKAKAAKAG
jgi:endogenous inhibitor of DNA gyrase (YacG/DUF329 family)